MCFSLYSHACFVIFHSTAALVLSDNSLTGTIPSEVALMSNLCESSVAWLLVVMIAMCFSLFSHACLSFFHSTDYLDLSGNNLTGEFTCPARAFIDQCYISCDDYNNDTCQSL
jgi:hypothetical protein